jgi:hypothetical protein
MDLPSFLISDRISRDRIPEFVVHGFEEMDSFSFFRGSKPVVPILRESIQVAANLQEVGDLKIHVGNFGLKQTMDAKTGCASAITHSENRFQFGERAPDAEGALDQFDAVSRLRGIVSIVASRALRFGQKAQPLVVPQCIGADSGSLRKLSRSHGLLPWVRV